MIVAMTRKDMAPPAAMREWSDYYIKAARAASREGQPRVPVVFVDARQGVDIHRLKMIALKAGAAVNQRCDAASSYLRLRGSRLMLPADP